MSWRLRRAARANAAARGLHGLAAQLSPEPLAVGKVHREQTLECRQPAARGRRPTAIAFQLSDDLALMCDAFLGLDDVPFGLGQMFLPDGPIHRTSGHLDRDK